MAPQARGQATKFTGTLTISVPNAQAGGTTEITYAVGDSLLRLDFPPIGGRSSSALIVDRHTNSAWMVSYEARSFYDLSESWKRLVRVNRKLLHGYTRTNSVKTIAGLTCEQWQRESPTAVMCLTDQLGAFDLGLLFALLGNGGLAGEELRADGKDLFPLALERNGSTVLRVTHVTRGAMTASFFSVPESFRLLPLPSKE